MNLLDRCTADLEAAKARWQADDDKLREFVGQNYAVIDGRMVLLGSSVTDGSKSGEYYELLRAADRSRTEFNKAIEAWARAKSEAA